MSVKVQSWLCNALFINKRKYEHCSPRSVAPALRVQLPAPGGLQPRQAEDRAGGGEAVRHQRGLSPVRDCGGRPSRREFLNLDIDPSRELLFCTSLYLGKNELFRAISYWIPFIKYFGSLRNATKSRHQISKAVVAAFQKCQCRN